MLFSSMTFISIFLPLVCGIYLLSKKEFHNMILLIASIIFYAWGEPRYLAIMLLTIIINYFGAIGVNKFNNHRKTILYSILIANISFLIYFKYFNFIITNCNNLFHSHISALDIVMPIGISFYTFQALSYVIDVYRGECEVQKDIYKLALYICLFPQLIAGPIVKYHDVAEQITDRDVNFEKVTYGIKRFIIGLSKKVLLANTMGLVVDKIFTQSPDAFTTPVAWLGAICYSFQLFFDFSGYSDMAIGLGSIFGFKFLENFNYPYISKSITEFWRRWHISLSTWFKQYVYISLGGNRCGMLKTVRNLGIVFLLTGIWHGAAWNFAFWGIWHGIFIIIEKVLNIKEFENKPHSVFINILRHFYCILTFVIGWVMFRADSMSYAGKYILNMFGCLNLNTQLNNYSISYYGDTWEIMIFIIAALCCTPVFNRIKLYTQTTDSLKEKWIGGLTNLWFILLFILSIASIAASTYNPFIYFRF